MIQLPRLYVKGKFSRLVNPINVSITDNMKPLSTASITLPKGEELPIRSWVELFNPYGSVGMFRVRSPRNNYGKESSTAELEHMIAEVGDYLVKEEISEMMAGTTAIKRIFDHYKGGKWKLGKYSDVGSGKVAVEVSYDNVLNALMSILEQKPECMMKYDFSTTPWTISIVKKGTSVMSEGRISRNVTSATVTYDDSELCTRVWYQIFSTVKDKDGNETVEAKWVYKDADTLKNYDNPIEGRVGTSSDMTTAEINAVVDNFLREHKQPKASVSIQGIELSKITGERMDKFVVGDLHRLALPDYGVTVELNITSISWNNVYSQSMNVVVNLGEEEDTVVTFLHNLDATGSGTRGGGGGGGGRKKQEEKWKEYSTKFEQDDRRISMTAQRVDRANNILEQAGLRLNSKGVLIYAKDNKNNLQSKLDVTSDAIKAEAKARSGKDEELSGKIKVQAGRISLVVEEKDGKNVIKSASIITAINSDGSSIVLSADKIDLQGSVLADEISTERGRITNLMAGNSLFSKVWATTVSTSVLQVGGTTASWQLKNIPGVGYINYLGA